MRALVLAGGEGSRLRPITHTSAKQLIPIAGAPIVYHALEAIAEAGIREVGVVVGHTGDEVRDAIGDGARWGLEVTYIEQDAPRGLAHAVLAAADFVRGQPFLMYLGDNVILEGVARFVRGFEAARPDAQIFVARVPEPERFGVVEVRGDTAVRVVEKPTAFVSDLALVGVYLFDDSIVEACAALQPSGRGELEITEAIQSLIDAGRTVRVEMLDGWWKDTGKPDDLLEANRMMLSRLCPRLDGTVDAATTLEGAVAIGDGAQVRDSHLVGPVVIGAGCVIEDSTVGPDVSMEPGCRIVGSTVTDAVLMQGCEVTGVAGLTASILGRGVVVRHGAGATHRLVVGDQSLIEVD